MIDLMDRWLVLPPYSIALAIFDAEILMGGRFVLGMTSTNSRRMGEYSLSLPSKRNIVLHVKQIN